jgi:cysteinyl-tRNA synthetase
MAKSVGNVATLADALDEFGRDALIVYMLGGHYRQPLAFSDERMEEARQAARRIADFARLVQRSGDLTGGDEDPGVAALREEFIAALRDDFNTPEALAALFKLISEGNRRINAGRPLAGARSVLQEMLDLLGLERMLEEGGAVDEDALRLVQEREDARLARDYARADAARDALRERGWEVRDTPEGPELVPAAS